MPTGVEPRQPAFTVFAAYHQNICQAQRFRFKWLALGSRYHSEPHLALQENQFFPATATVVTIRVTITMLFT